jgi:hypothetical protein
MAQKVRVFLVDDLDGSGADETVSFTLDGADYEIDLSSRNAEEFRKVLAPYIQHARRARPASRRQRTRTAVSGERSSRVRAWAQQRGYKVSERGRIPAQVLREFEQHRGAGPGPDFGDDDE